MTLGTFQPRQRISGDKLLLNNYVGRPLLVRTNEYAEAFTSQAYPNPKPVVFCDVVDLISGQIFINVLWGGGAVVDNLKEFAGTEVIMPVKPGLATGNSGRSYQTLLALEGNEAAAAQQWYQQYWPLVDQERAKREAASRPLTNAPAQQGFGAPQAQPPAAAPQQFQTPAVNQQPQYPAAQPGYGAPQGQPLPHDQQGYAAPAAQSQQAFQNQGMPPAQAQQAVAQQYTQPQGQMPGYGGPQGAPGIADAGQFAQPNAAPQGMFTDAPPPAQQGQGFAAPATQPDPNAMLAQLNQQLS